MTLPSYELLIRGRLDDLMQALFAEYELRDVPVDIAVHGLPMSRTALSELLDRADELGLTVVAAQRVD